MRALVLVLAAAALLLPGSGGTVALGGPQFRAALSGQNRTPTAGARWHFVVRAVDGNGRPVSGTAIVRVLVRSRVVDTVGWFAFKETLRRTYRWSPQLRGSSAVLQAKVVGPGGTRTVGYAVRVGSDWAAATGRPRFRSSLTGGGHAARAGARWRFVVRAVDANGRPAGGTAIVRVLVRGGVVDTVGWFAFKGTLRRTYRWSPQLQGSSAVLQAKVVGPGGTRTVGYAVRVR